MPFLTAAFGFVRTYSKLFLIGAAVAGALTLYTKGRSDGKAALMARLASERIELMKDGRKIDEEIFNASDDELCAILGGCLQPNDE